MLKDRKLIIMILYKHVNIHHIHCVLFSQFRHLISCFAVTSHSCFILLNEIQWHQIRLRWL